MLQAKSTHTPLTPHMDAGTRATRVIIHIRIFAALRFFAHGSYQKASGNEMHVALSQPAFSRALYEVCLALESIAHRWIKFPITEAEKQEKKEEFMARFGFPGVVGCIDGTHIVIVAPREDEHLYFNRKQYHSKNVQLICDANLMILNVKSNYGGASHDAFIWRNSNVRTHLEQMYDQGDHNSWLLGDSGYLQEPWLMTPIQGVPRDTPEGSIYGSFNKYQKLCGKMYRSIEKPISLSTEGQGLTL
ncbi:putative nuclease HARBI1 [Anoplophora glabripennis]|uniref:putative nuclease HARBI1 n=1 Tax=Anoplophora glabripennis TaxID=217634 RepID=UPI0008756E46|nr:putative nuclease HARBI1 [Anoplophora glabripennis]